MTHFELEELLPRHALLRVRLETGRTHQIRVHLAAIDLPVAGDPTYGDRAETSASSGSSSTRRGSPSRIRSPASRVDVSSPLPPDLAAALAAARQLTFPASRSYSPAAQPWRVCLSSREVRLDPAGARQQTNPEGAFHGSFD